MKMSFGRHVALLQHYGRKLQWDRRFFGIFSNVRTYLRLSRPDRELLQHAGLLATHSLLDIVVPCRASSTTTPFLNRPMPPGPDISRQVRATPPDRSARARASILELTDPRIFAILPPKTASVLRSLPQRGPRRRRQGFARRTLPGEDRFHGGDGERFCSAGYKEDLWCAGRK